jgi:two-component system, NarL family, invasion response regulator UvrY
MPASHSLHRILLLDPQPIVHLGVAQLLHDAEGSGIIPCFSSEEAARVSAEAGIVAVIADPPAWDEGFESLLARWKMQHVPVIIFSLREDPPSVQRALRCGAKGYVSKRETGEELLKTVAEARRGNWHASPRISRILLEGIARPQSLLTLGQKTLSAREQEVFSLAAEALSAREISERLGVSRKTIESHVSRIKEKLQVTNWRDLQRMAAAQARVRDEPG